MKKILVSILIPIAMIAFSGCETTYHVEKGKVPLHVKRVAPAAAPAIVTTPEPIFIKPSTEWPAIIPVPLKSITSGGCLDYVDNRSAVKQVTVSDKSKVKFVGWTANVEKGTIPQFVYLKFEGPMQAYLKIETRLNRPDVATYFNKLDLAVSGWEAYADLTALASGTYKVKIIQIEGKNGLLYDTDRSFNLTSSDHESKKAN
jgi:hypothetical protein